MVEMIEIGPADRQCFAEYVEHCALADFRQTYEWGEVRARDGWVARRFLARRDDETVGAASVLAGRLPHLPFNLLHVPCGPLIDYHSPDVVAAFAALLRRLAVEAGAGFVRIDPPLPCDDAVAHQNMLSADFSPSQLAWSYWNAPTEALRIDLSASEEVLFRRMRHSQRKNLKRFDRGGNVVVASRDPRDLWDLRRMLCDLGARKGFTVRGAAYWQSLWSEFVERRRGFLLVARSGDKVLGCMFTVICGRTCFTLHAAHDPSEQRERPNDGLYWASIRHARSVGCSVLDMMGYVSESHLHFKLGLGAEVVKLAGYYDLVVRPTSHRLFSLVEKHMLPRVVPIAVRLRSRPAPSKPVSAATSSDRDDHSDSGDD